MLEIGQRASYSKTVTEEDVNRFAELSGDYNPIHINESEASKSVFGKRIVHGMLSASLISGVLGSYLPGTGTIYLSQSLSFLKPVAIGEKVTAIVQVTDIIKPEKGIYKLRTWCEDQSGETVVDGEAVVKYIDVQGDKG